MATVNRDFEVKNGLRVNNGLINANGGVVAVTGNVTVSQHLTVTNTSTFSNTATFNGSMVTFNSPLIYYNAVTQGVTALGTISSGGTATLNFNSAQYFTMTMSGNATWNITNLPGSYWEIHVQVTNPAAGTITINRAGSALSVNWVKGDGTSSTTFSNMGVTLGGSGVVNHFIFWGNGTSGNVYGRAM